MGKHSSYNEPPNLPYFGKRCQASSSADENLSATLSPAKRVKLRTECIDQLSKLHTLLEKGGVQSEVYETLKKAILSDMQNFQQL